MDTLRVGVIGVGMGAGHVGGFRQHERAEVVALADIDEKRLKKANEDLKVPNLYTSAEKMIAEEKLDIVAVATPNKFHKPLTIAALESGAHVLCEKPMAMNAVEAQEMLDAAEKAGKRIMINFSYRFINRAQCMKKQVDAGILGDVYFGQTLWHRRRGIPGFGGWFGQKALSGGGPLIDLGVHRLDLALWLMGYPKPVWVMGSAYNHIATRLAKEQGKEYDCEDLAAGMIKFDNGATLEVEASWAANIEERERMETRLMGTEGGVIFRNLEEGYGKWEMKFFVERDGQQFDLEPHEPINGGESAMCHFVDCIVNDKQHIATGEEGKIVMQILDAIYASAEKGEPVKIG
jgi:predicted dehydrogenase